MKSVLITGVQIVLLMAGAILLGFSIFMPKNMQPGNWYLAGALACIFIANLINIIRMRKGKARNES